MKTVKVKIPDDLEKFLESIPVDIESFILESIRKRFEEKQTEKLLIEGYKTGYQESKKISNEFKNVDLENWDE